MANQPPGHGLAASEEESGPVRADRLLDAWQHAAGQHPLHRALTLLTLQDSGLAPEQAAALPLGDRDRRLFALRQRISGGTFDAVADCAACGERMELSFIAADLLNGLAPAVPESRFDFGGRELRLRPPSTFDAMHAAAQPSRAAARAMLLERCVSGVDGPLPEDVAAKAEALLDDMDPVANIRLEIPCPSCGHRADAPFDVGAYLWVEVDRRARILLREVHALASAYCWAEADILAMNPGRRRAYLDLVGTP